MTQTDRATPDREGALSLVLFTNSFAAFVAAGLSLVRSLQLLETLPPPAGPAAKQLRQEVESGAALSRAMAEQPETFSPFYVALVRLGEVGRILDETLQHASDLLTTEWRLICRETALDAVLLAAPLGKPYPSRMAELSAVQRLVVQMEFCRAFGMLLASGVPILQALDTAGMLLPSGEAAAVQAAREAMKQGDDVAPALAAAGFLPEYVIDLVAAGQAAGSLDALLERVASVMAHELDCRLAENGGVGR